MKRTTALTSHAKTRLPVRLAASVCALLVACGGGDPAAEPDPPPACMNLPNEITWHRSGTASADWSDVMIDGRNRIWLAGYADGVVGQSNIEPSGNSRAVVRQLSPTGDLLWDSGNLFDTAGTDVAEALAMSPAGTVYMVGRTTGNLAGVLNAAQFDTFLAWSDTPGTATSWRTFQTGNERPQHPRRLHVDANGDVHVAGYDDDYIPSNYVAAWSDPFAMRLKRLDAGTVTDRLAPQWSHHFDTTEGDFADGLTVDAAGATYLSGVVQSGAQRGMFVRKLDGDGRPLWTTRYSNSPTDNIAALRALPDGSLLVAGSVFGSFNGGAWQGQQDVFVAHISAADGHVLASWQFGTEGGDWLTDLGVDAQGNIILFGETDGEFVHGQAAAGLGDLFMLKLAADGTVAARTQWGTDADERAQHLAIDSCGRVAAVGSSTKSGIRSGLLWFWKP